MPTQPVALRLAATKAYGTHTVLRDVRLEVATTETVGILGPNGSGKTTLLRLASTLTRPTEGTVHVLGHDAVRDGEAARRNLGVLTQAAPIDGEATPAEALRWWLRLHRRPTQDVPDLLAGAGLARVADAPAGHLSRGQRQRLALLTALAHGPELAVLDEPFTALDAAGSAWLEGLLAARRGRQATVLALHDEAQAARLCDRIVRLPMAGGGAA